MRQYSNNLKIKGRIIENCGFREPFVTLVVKIDLCTSHNRRPGHSIYIECRRLSEHCAPSESKSPL